MGNDLTISKNLTEMMNGNIGLDSDIGVGTVFWIEVSEAVIDFTQLNIP